MQETWVQFLGWEHSLEKEMETHFSILSVKSHGQRSLVGYSVWGHKRVGHNLTTSSVQSVQLFVTPWTAARQASLSMTNSWSLLKLMSIMLVMPSNHFILCHLLLLPPSIFPGIRVSSRVGSSHQVAKVLEFQPQHQSFQRTLRTDFL